MSPAHEKSLAERLHVLREERGLSLGDLEQRAGVSKGYISELERGEAKNPSIDVLKKIAVGLEVLIQDLVGDAIEVTEDTAARGKMAPGLAAYLKDARDRGSPLSENDVAMLQGIQYRGRHPRTAEDYALIYDMVKRIVK